MFAILRKFVSKYKLLFILLPYLVIVSAIIYVGYDKCRPTYIKDGVKYTRNLCGSVKTAEKLPTPKNPNEKKVNVKVYTEGTVNYYEIVDTSKNPHFPTGLKFSEKDLPSPTVVRWNSFLLGVNIENYVDKSGGAFLGSNASEHYTLQSQIRSVRAYNIDTGETFDIALDKPTWGEIWYFTSQVVDNSYYFGVGGAFGPSLGYKLDLPPQRNSRIVKLKSSIGNTVEKIGNIYLSSFCYEGCQYSLFNPASTSTTPLNRMTDASNGYNSSKKEDFIGIDSAGRMILNVRDIPRNISNQQVFDTEQIVAVPLSDEKTTIVLLNSKDLPEKIHRYFMIDGIDKVVMIGEAKAYVYDIVQNKITEIQIGQELKSMLLNTKTDNSISATKTKTAICFGNTDKIVSAIDLSNNTYLDTPPSDCKKVYADKTKEEVFSELNLPKNFEFIFTPISYKTYNVINGVPESEIPKGAEIIK